MKILLVPIQAKKFAGSLFVEVIHFIEVKSASHDVDLSKTSEMVRKMEKQRNIDEQNWKAQMDAVHDVHKQVKRQQL